MTTLTPDADSIDGVLERMDAIATALPPGDGIATFNRMYREVTRLVDLAVDHSAFTADPFLARLDVHFANLFFDAYVADQRGQRVPPAWRPLFEARSKPHTQPIQFAFAGMNAHISHDLACAVVTTCQELGVVPRGDTPEHSDFSATNDVLAQAMGEIKSWFISGVMARLDADAGKVDDAFEMFGIDTARAAAWEVSQVLWDLLDNPAMDRAFRSTLARSVGLASRGILL